MGANLSERDSLGMDVGAKCSASPFLAQCVDGVKYHGTGVTKCPYLERNIFTIQCWQGGKPALLSAGGHSDLDRETIVHGAVSDPQSS